MMDGSNRLPVLAAGICREISKSRSHGKQSLEHAINAGATLVEAKDLVKHGEWLPWLKEHCDISDRTARHYMRLARHRGVIDTKSATVADLTVRAAVEELTTSKLPNKLSDVGRLALDIPPAGRVRVGLREGEAGWDEVWIAPSLKHSGFYFVSHIWTPNSGAVASLTGSEKPILADRVPNVIDVHFSHERKELTWLDWDSSAWSENFLLSADINDTASGTSHASKPLLQHYTIACLRSMSRSAYSGAALHQALRQARSVHAATVQDCSFVDWLKLNTDLPDEFAEQAPDWIDRDFDATKHIETVVQTIEEGAQ